MTTTTIANNNNDNDNDNDDNILYFTLTLLYLQNYSVHGQDIWELSRIFRLF